MPPQNGGYKKKRGSLAFAYPTIQALACPSEKISNAIAHARMIYSKSPRLSPARMTDVSSHVDVPVAASSFCNLSNRQVCIVKEKRQ